MPSPQKFFAVQREIYILLKVKLHNMLTISFRWKFRSFVWGGEMVCRSRIYCFREIISLCYRRYRCNFIPSPFSLCHFSRNKNTTTNNNNNEPDISHFTQRKNLNVLWLKKKTERKKRTKCNFYPLLAKCVANNFSIRRIYIPSFVVPNEH